MSKSELKRQCAKPAGYDLSHDLSRTGEIEMTKWAQWLVNHNLRFIVYVIVIPCILWYFITEFPNLYGELKRDFKLKATQRKSR